MRSGLERRMELPHKGRIRHCRGEQLQDSTQHSSGWGQADRLSGNSWEAEEPDEKPPRP